MASSELIKVGQFVPDPVRHEGFGFVDQESGLGHQVADLHFHPRKPGRLVGTLSTLFDDYQIAPLLDVSWEAGYIQESRLIELVPSQSFLNNANLVSRVAVGSLAVRYK